ncbi:lamin tail domain-containing protein, partial [Patescibacteria group bacterium]|nr:lamin tail domain-containing protein [Patescibacteria group bacterium]MBU1868016.1 lamin tail domain-containing protein [Patescibacteria group bacterium]
MHTNRVFPHLLLSLLLVLLVVCGSYSVTTAEWLPSGSVVINEVMWMGTGASSSDEWLELYNTSDLEIDLTGWGVYEAAGSELIEPLGGLIAAHSYYLVERTDDNTVSDVPASQPPTSWGGYGLSNDGEHLVLLDADGNIIDEVIASSGWFTGDGSEKRSMERIDPNDSGSLSSNWCTNDGVTINGLDANGDKILGTPKIQNSCY